MAEGCEEKRYLYDNSNCLLITIKTKELNEDSIGHKKVHNATTHLLIGHLGFVSFIWKANLSEAFAYTDISIIVMLHEFDVIKRYYSC